MNKNATTDHPIHELLVKRWSPCAFDSRPVSAQDLQSLFEAARWAASSYNEQPWHYLIATQQQPQEFERLLSCLVEGNQAWAKTAPVLAISVASLTFKLNGKPNAAALHDLGAAACSLTVEATARGLLVHQMIGILPDRARELYGIPRGYEAVTGLAIGYLGDATRLPEKLRQRDLAPRARKSLQEFVFEGQWGKAARTLTILAVLGIMVAGCVTTHPATTSAQPGAGPTITVTPSQDCGCSHKTSASPFSKP